MVLEGSRHDLSSTGRSAVYQAHHGNVQGRARFFYRYGCDLTLDILFQEYGSSRKKQARRRDGLGKQAPWIITQIEDEPHELFFLDLVQGLLNVLSNTIAEAGNA